MIHQYTAFTDGGCYTRKDGTTTPSYFSFQIWNTTSFRNTMGNNKPIYAIDKFYLRSLIPLTHQRAKDRKGQMDETINIENDFSLFVPANCSIFNDKGRETNNIAEYAAMYYCLARLFTIIKPQSSTEIFSDSQLIVNQLLGEYKCRQDHLIPWHKVTSSLLSKMNITLTWTERTNIERILGH